MDEYCGKFLWQTYEGVKVLCRDKKGHQGICLPFERRYTPSGKTVDYHRLPSSPWPGFQFRG